MNRIPLADYYKKPPHKIDLIATCYANKDILNKYIEAHKLPTIIKITFKFAVHYALVRGFVNTEIYRNYRDYEMVWYDRLVDSYLVNRSQRPQVQLDIIKYSPITKAPDFTLKYLRDREIGRV